MREYNRLNGSTLAQTQLADSKSAAKSNGDSAGMHGGLGNNSRPRIQAHCVASRDKCFINPTKLPYLDPTDPAKILAHGLARLGHGASWVAPSLAFSDRFTLTDQEWCVISGQPRHHNDRLVNFLSTHPEGHIALSAGGAQLDLLPQLLQQNWVEVLHLSVDQLQAATGDYNVERALAKLGFWNCDALIIATNPQTALAIHRGVIYRVPALSLEGPVCGEGKRAAFLAGFLAIYAKTGDIAQALRAGHANAAAVAQGAQPVKALLNRQQLESFLLMPPPTEPSYYKRPAKLAAVGVGLAALLGLTLLAAGKM